MRGSSFRTSSRASASRRSRPARPSSPRCSICSSPDARRAATSMTRAPEIDFRPYDPAFAADPYAVYARLRDESPIFHAAQTGLVMFARHDDVRGLVLDRRLGRSLDGVLAAGELAERRRDAEWERLPAYSRYVRVNLLETEGADHARVRRLVAAAFSPRRIRDLREGIRARVGRLLDAHAPAGRMEFIADVAAPLPVGVIADLLGWPEDEHDRLRPWSAQIVRLYEKDHSADDEQRAELATDRKSVV